MRVKFQMQQPNISYYPLGNNNYTFFICLNEKIVEETPQYEEGTAVSTLYEYDFNEFNKRIELLKSKREEAFEQGDIQKFELISNYINLKIIDVFYEIKKDSQDRILLPKMIRQMYEIEKSILLFELLDRVNVFKNFEQCDEYKRELSKKFSYIC